MNAERKAARVIIADDHRFMRVGLRSILESEPDFEVVGEAATGTEAVNLCLRLRPDLALVDVRMPEIDGLRATRTIRKAVPQTSVIMVTMHENPDYLYEALKAGAAGYILKDATDEELISAARKVLEGDSLLSMEVSSRLLRKLVGEESRERARTSPSLPSSEEKDIMWGKGAPFEALTPRELEVLALLSKGLTNPQIARKLSVEAGTVKTHVRRIISKLGVSDRTQAAVRAIGLGIITSDYFF
jgi:DNA-binding NarL/FixJ family response regulator